MKIKGFESKTVSDYTREKSKREVLEKFPGTYSRQRPRNPLERDALLFIEKITGQKSGTI